MGVNVLIEVRPLVQACSVFLSVPFPQACIRLVVHPNELTVTWSLGSKELLTHTVSLPPHFPIKFQPCQVSSLLQEEKHVSFRVQTSPRNLTGSFSVQLLESEKSASHFVESAPIIPVSVPCYIHCSCCGQNIVSKDAITFDRVLPLPSCSYDAGDFFCHNHGESKINVDPRKLDCFYSTSGFHIHPSHVECKGDIIRCRCCLAWIGTISDSRACLWHSTVDVKPVCLQTSSQVTKLNPAQEFIFIVNSTIEQCPSVLCRLMINVKISTDVSHFLLIHVMDRQLTLLSTMSSKSSEVTSHKAVKVSFHLEKQCNNVVSTWQNDSLVSCIEVSLPVFVQGLKLLSKTSQFIPSSYRKAQDDFLLGYLSLDFID